MTGTFKHRVGSRAQVFHSQCERTSGGLKKKDLMMHKGRIVSRKKHAQGKKAIKRLFALGYKPTKGKFSLMRKSGKSKKMSRRTRKKGGAAGAMDNFADASGAQPNPIQAAMDAMKGM
jgi:hypothetical protein